MSMVVAVREGMSEGFVGFLSDRMTVECGECREAASYRLLYSEDQKSNLVEHRFAAHRRIDAEHPNHSDKIRIL
jgi:hypothetical protein